MAIYIELLRSSGWSIILNSADFIWIYLYWITRGSTFSVVIDFETLLRIHIDNNRLYFILAPRSSTMWIAIFETYGYGDVNKTKRASKSLFRFYR